MSGFIGYFLLGSDQTGNNCIFQYNQNSDTIQLYDANFSPPRVVRSGARTAVADLANDFCVIHTGGNSLTDLSADLTGMTVSLTIEFLRGFDDIHNFYPYAYDPIYGGRQTGFSGSLGTVIAWGAGPAILTPNAVTLGPSAATGSFSVSTGSGYNIVTSGGTWFTATKTGPTVAYSVSALPANATAPRSGQVTVTTTAYTTAYSSTFTITQTPNPDFTISISALIPELARRPFVRPYQVTVTRMNGYVADIDLDKILPALPHGANLSVTFSPSKLVWTGSPSFVSANQTATVTIDTGVTSITQWGDYVINVIGKGPQTTKSAHALVKVQDFYVTANPYWTFTAPLPTAFTHGVSYAAFGLNGYSEPITLTVPPPNAVPPGVPANPWYQNFCTGPQVVFSNTSPLPAGLTLLPSGIPSEALPQTDELYLR